MSEIDYQRFLDWRGIETPCKKCSGTGTYVYSNTSTWNHGIGGQALTSAVCEDCWGSGDANRKWSDIRVAVRTERELRLRVEALEKALRAFADPLQRFDLVGSDNENTLLIQVTTEEMGEAHRLAYASPLNTASDKQEV